jgi:hypothetical protein
MVIIDFLATVGETAIGTVEVDAGAAGAAGAEAVVCVGLVAGRIGASWESFKRIVGAENVKFRARNVSQPSFSCTASVATF